MFQGVIGQVRRAIRRIIVRTVVVVGGIELTTHLPSQGRSSLLYHTVADDYVTPAMRTWLGPESTSTRHFLDGLAAHDVALFMAKRGLAPQHHPSAAEQRVKLQQKSVLPGLTFDNPIGLAAGFDKDGAVIVPMLQLGFGAVEIGTVTPSPQPGNPRPRMYRLVEDLGVINRYGFNSQGTDVVRQNLQAYRTLQSFATNEAISWWRALYNYVYQPQPPKGVVGVNLGKNKWTEDAIDDYISNIQTLGPYADYLVINVSSPNTPGLRNLQESTQLRAVLQSCLQARDTLETKVPLLVKLAPDLADDELERLAKLALELGMDGVVVTNTSNQRPLSLRSVHQQQVGGLSGAPIKDRATECIRLVFAATQGQLPIIGVGGIGRGQDVYDKLKAGASVVQVYSMMVYHGPGCISRMRRELAELMLQNGQRTMADVVGLDHENIFWQQREYRRHKRRQTEGVLVVDAL